jgi:1-aminocyclopropane-1-carboxylate deaminase/D-cysteine desulfhydrase-like pyridoxal-dependent ACC family enzyme
LIYDYCGKEFFNWKIETQYHFGGYAKTSRLLSDFIREFQDDHTIPLDPVYNAKMVFALLHQIDQRKFDRGTTILALHTGGLQVNSG